MPENFTSLAQQIGNLFAKNQLILATAESCTGGWVSTVLTSVPGSSNWFDCGFVTYSNQAKHTMLNVSMETLNTYGAVSEETAEAMAKGVIQASPADFSLSVTGIAGPDGGSLEKPVGLVWFSLASKCYNSRNLCCNFSGDREAIRKQSVEYILQELLVYVRDNFKD